jgi:hypothetical protein
MILVGDQRVGSIGECKDIGTISPYVWCGCWPLARLESGLQLLQVIVGANNDTLILICGKVREALSHQSLCVHCPCFSLQILVNRRQELCWLRFLQHLEEYLLSYLEERVWWWFSTIQWWSRHQSNWYLTNQPLSAESLCEWICDTKLLFGMLIFCILSQRHQPTSWEMDWLMIIL